MLMAEWKILKDSCLDEWSNVVGLGPILAEREGGEVQDDEDILDHEMELQ